MDIDSLAQWLIVLFTLDSHPITRYHFCEKRVGETLLTIRCRQIPNQIVKIYFSAIPFLNRCTMSVGVFIGLFVGGIDVRKKDNKNE